MRIAALVPTSLVDYPGFIAAVLFTQGCNLRCGYCHNPALLDGERPGSVSAADVLSHLRRRKGVLDGLVMSGGEPTLQFGLTEFLGKVKENGFLVKLDTNGTVPLVLEQLIRGKLLDFVAMDIKAPPERYREICGPAADLAAVRESVRLLRRAGIQTEFRTTLAPGLGMDDLREIMAWIGPSPRFVLQRYRAATDRQNGASCENGNRREIAMAFQKRFSICQLRGFS